MWSWLARKLLPYLALEGCYNLESKGEYIIVVGDDIEPAALSELSGFFARVAGDGKFIIVKTRGRVDVLSFK